MDSNQAVPQVVEVEETNKEGENPFLVKKRMGWCGRFEADEWYCGCGRKPKHLPTTRTNSRNFGRMFYMCPVRDPKQEGDPEPCQFFLWDEDEEEAKKYMELNPTTPRKPLPKPREIRTPNHGSSKKLNEWLSGNGKKRAANDISDEDAPQAIDEDKQSDEDFVVVGAGSFETSFGPENTRNGSPSRKSAKVTRFTTPGQPLAYALDGQNALPTPITGGTYSDNAARQLRARDSSPTPARLHAAINLDDSEPELLPEKTNLSEVVLGYIKADYPGLSETTETMICHEIEIEAQRAQTELKVCRRTIARLRREVGKMKEKMADLEKTVHTLCGGGFAEDAVVLSD